LAVLRPGKEVCGGAEIFGSALLQAARSVCVYPSAFFIVSDLMEGIEGFIASEIFQ